MGRLVKFGERNEVLIFIASTIVVQLPSAEQEKFCPDQALKAVATPQRFPYSLGMKLSTLNIEILLMVACLVAIVARRARIPYTVGLVIAGMILAHFDIAPPFQLSRELIFSWLLPPLIFESAMHLSWRDLKPQLPVVSFLATVGVFAAALITTLLLVTTVGLPWPAAITIGIVLSATDPVSVLALLKEAKLPARIHKLIESESLLNDGTAAALFTMAPLIIAGTAGLGGIVKLSTLSILGGIGMGIVVGLVALILAKGTRDHLVETTVTILAAFGSFLAAEHFGASGILSTLAAGMVVGNARSLGAISKEGYEASDTFWEFAGFIANSVIFLLIGVGLDDLQVSEHITVVAATIGASLVGRAAAVYLGCLPFRRSQHPVPLPVQHLLFWGGLRGALALALVLGLDPSAPDTALIRIAVFYAVAFSIIIQGLTVGRLIRSLKAP